MNKSRQSDIFLAIAE